MKMKLNQSLLNERLIKNHNILALFNYPVNEHGAVFFLLQVKEHGLCLFFTHAL